jgi:hypothetical protein
VLALSYGSATAATIDQSGSNFIAFEAEIGDIDNTYDTPSIGWLVDGVTTPPAGASGGSLVVSTENNSDGDPQPHNTLTYNIDFTKSGSYSFWFRAAFTGQGYEDTRTNAPNNDSFYYESGTIDDATLEWTTLNSLSVLSDTSWKWYNGGANIDVSAAGASSWLISNREDGMILDRIVLVHPDYTGTVDAAMLDGLANNPVPEPSTLSLAVLGLIGLIRRRRR